MKDLTSSIGAINYEQAAIFIGALVDNIIRWVREDLALKNKKRLAGELYTVAAFLN